MISGPLSYRVFRETGPWGPLSYFEIKVLRKLRCVLGSNEVHFVSLAENFTV